MNGLNTQRSRAMRIILFFDLPTLTSKERKVYRQFRKKLINNGYIMLQESVYSKLVTNYTSCESEIERLKKTKPAEGLVQCLAITEKQYANIINITGKLSTDKINSVDRMVII